MAMIMSPTTNEPISGEERTDSSVLDLGHPDEHQTQPSLDNDIVDEAQREADGRRALIEFAVSLAVVLILEQILLPFPDITRQRLEVGTVLIYANLWFLFYGVIWPKRKR
jgi:hypothetical protein